MRGSRWCTCWTPSYNKKVQVCLRESSTRKSVEGRLPAWKCVLHRACGGVELGVLACVCVVWEGIDLSENIRSLRAFRASGPHCESDVQ